MDVVKRYLSVFEALRRRKHWTMDVTVLRLAAMTLMAAEVRDPWGDLHRAAETLKDRASWFSPIRSPIRYALAAMVLRRDLDPGRTHDRVQNLLERFRAAKLRPGSIQAVLSAFLIVLHHGDAPVPDEVLTRMAAILRRWKTDHPFLTGIDDYPMAALHATRAEGVEECGTRVESVYQALRVRKMRRGNALQLASHLVSLGAGSPAERALRFDRVRTALVERGERVGTGRYDEVAILSLTTARPADLARRFIRDRDALRAAKPRPSADLAFSLAAGIALAREVPRGRAVGDFAAVAAAQAAIEAQTAAVMAGVIAASAATSAAT